MVILARNKEAFIEKVTQSGIGQTILPSKWVIMNDGSTAATASIVSRYLATGIEVRRRGLCVQ
jgi:glycosyltransferase involved in cell wall biosynthesis